MGANMTDSNTKAEKTLSRILKILPSLALLSFYIPNALDKLIHHDQTGKIVESSAVMISAGIFLFLGMGLFLYRKTVLIGTTMLVSYMSLIVMIHMYKEKPAEVVMLIGIATIFAAYLRAPQLFHEKEGQWKKL